MSQYEKIKFLESTTNLKAIIKRTTGRSPSTEIARDITACLQQGRLFFEIAESAPLQIQPLQIYYGIVGFAKAVILARTVQSIATIEQTHGLSDISEQNTKIENLSLKFQKRGTFQQFNDVVAPLGRINHFGDGGMYLSDSKPFDASFELAEKKASLKDILSRVPGLQKLYAKTFAEDAACTSVSFYKPTEDCVQLRIDDTHLFRNKDELKSIVEKWRRKFPFLNGWCFCEGALAWDHTVLLFYNTQKQDQGEFEILTPDGSGFSTSPREWTYILPFSSILSPLAGGITRTHPTAIEPLNGFHLSEFALQFCGAFLLSSLVRYRPQVWQHALSHSILEQNPADDRTLSLIEAFSRLVLNEFPALVENCIDSTATVA
jgi:hypothetical protein